MKNFRDTDRIDLFEILHQANSYNLDIHLKRKGPMIEVHDSNERIMSSNSEDNIKIYLTGFLNGVQHEQSKNQSSNS